MDSKGRAVHPLLSRVEQSVRDFRAEADTSDDVTALLARRF